MPKRRIPHGMRGLKLDNHMMVTDTAFRRIPHGMRGLKYSSAPSLLRRNSCRIPHGMRGLKYLKKSAKSMLKKGKVASRMGCVD